MEKLKGMQTNDKERASNHFLHPYFGPVGIKRGAKYKYKCRGLIWYKRSE